MSPGVPDVCTLPTAERPTRLAEFDALLATAIGVDTLSPTHARMRLAGPTGLADRTRDLTARETECCSFFAFSVTPVPAGGGELVILDIEVPAVHAGVLESMVERASAAAGAAR